MQRQVPNTCLPPTIAPVRFGGLEVGSAGSEDTANDGGGLEPFEPIGCWSTRVQQGRSLGHTNNSPGGGEIEIIFLLLNPELGNHDFDESHTYRYIEVGPRWYFGVIRNIKGNPVGSERKIYINMWIPPTVSHKLPCKTCRKTSTCVAMSRGL